MSHNIGSHVIPRAGMKAIRDRIGNLLKTSGKDPLYGSLLVEIVGSLKKRLDDYIRQKADFLAKITTEPASSVSTAWLYRDVILPFISNTILMDCLAANEGQRYRKIDECALRLRLLISKKDKEPSEIQAIIGGRDSKHTGKGYVAPYSMRMPYDFEENISLYIERKDQDVMIALPGALGQYAVYGILENLIRNAAKHNRQEFSGQKRDLEITLWLKDTEEDPMYYTLLIYDSVTAPEQEVIVSLIEIQTVCEVPASGMAAYWVGGSGKKD